MSFLRVIKIIFFLLLLCFKAKANPSDIKSCTLSLIVSQNQVQDFENLFYKNTSKAGASYGTAFFYQNINKEHNYILTNFHVIEKALKQENKIVGCNENFECHELHLVMIDKKFDLAMLESPHNTHPNKDCNFVITDDFKEADKVIIYGNKLGMGGSFSHGIVSKINVKIEKNLEENIVNFFDINAGYGNSGGAIILENSNKIVGILNTVYSSNNFSSIVFGITPTNILTSIKRMNQMIETEKILEFYITEKDQNLYFEIHNENIFFETLNIKKTDQIQTINKKPITNKIEAIYEIYAFLDSDFEEIPITVITADKRLRSIRLKKYRSNADFTI